MSTISTSAEKVGSALRRTWASRPDLCKLVCWPCGYAGVRVGEASHPGPTNACPSCGSDLHTVIRRSAEPCSMCGERSGRGAQACEPCGGLLCLSCVATVNRSDPILSSQTQEAAAVGADIAASGLSAESPSGVVISGIVSLPAESMEQLSPAPARARACPCSGAYLVKRTLGSAVTCRQCGRERMRGCNIWACGACDRKLCPTCKEARPYWKGRRSDTPLIPKWRS